MGISIGLQVRRLLWVLQDLRRILRGLWRAIRYAREPDHSVCIGLLEGGAWARRGEVNAYRIRVVNDSPDARDVELLLRGERAGKDSLEVRQNQRVPANTARELFLMTDWEGCFEVASDPPPADPIAFLAGASTPESCRVTATLSAGGRHLDELTIMQRVTR